jgi:DNA-binding NarL/FixJ family response regulator
MLAGERGHCRITRPRELAVLKLAAWGVSNPDVARRLVPSEHTVDWHLANMLRKLGLSSPGLGAQPARLSLA